MGQFHQWATDRSQSALQPVSAQAAVRALRLVHHDESAPVPATERPAATDPRLLVARLAQAIAEVLARARQVGQLEGLLTAESARALQRAVDLGRLPVELPTPRPTVTSLRIATPRAGAIEACAVIDVGDRRRALAFRLDIAAERWQCTALRVG